MLTRATPEIWSPAQRLGFRFAFCYLLLFLLPVPLGWLPYTETLYEWYAAPWKAVVSWVGLHVLGLEGPIPMTGNGSGDTTADYLLLLVQVTLAAVATVVWSSLDRRRLAYQRLHDRLRIYVRVAFGFILISYGMAKVIKTQFPFPGPERLLQPYGESSPMGLLWTFMGHSTAYNVFTGAAEVLAGALVMFRRTTALGALLGIAVMANIVVLNFGYDVPVKIFSTQLLLTSAFLALPDARRLTNVLLLGRGAEPPPPRIPFRRAWLERARKPIAAATLVASLGLLTWERIDAYYERGDGADRPALYGVWQVESFAREGGTAASEDRWLRLAIGRWRATVGTADERVRRLEYEHDEEAHTLVLRDGHEELVSFDVQRLGAERLVLSGTYQGVPLRIALRRRQTDDFLLVERGFHWINEYPYNR